MGSSCIRFLLCRREKTRTKKKKKKAAFFYNCPCLIPIPLWLICICGVFGSFIITNVIRPTICAMCCGSYFLFRMICFYFLFFGPFDRIQHASKREASNCHYKYGVRMDDVMKLKRTCHLIAYTTTYYLQKREQSSTNTTTKLRKENNIFTYLPISKRLRG